MFRWEGKRGLPCLARFLSLGGCDVISLMDWNSLFFLVVRVSACSDFGADSKHDLPADMLIHSQMVLLFISPSCHNTQSLVLTHTEETNSQLAPSNFSKQSIKEALFFLDFLFLMTSKTEADCLLFCVNLPFYDVWEIVKTCVSMSFAF